MRTTFDIDDHLLRKAREEASRRGVSLKSVVEEALASMLAPRPSEPEPFRLRWKTHRGEYIGGVDVADRVALHDRMEEER